MALSQQFSLPKTGLLPSVMCKEIQTNKQKTNSQNQKETGKNQQQTNNSKGDIYCCVLSLILKASSAEKGNSHRILCIFCGAV